MELFHSGQWAVVSMLLDARGLSRQPTLSCLLNLDIFKSDDFIRLSPSVPNTKGFIWSEIPNPYEAWEVEIAFKVTGNNMHGGRGLAFWYTKDREESGPVFGSKDQWDGLSVWLDSANPVVGYNENTIDVKLSQFV